MLKSNKLKGFIFSFLSAFLYALNVLVLKKFLGDISSNELLFLLYMGSTIGILLIMLLKIMKKQHLNLKRKNYLLYLA